MSVEHPNHAHLHAGETSLGFSFGLLRSVTPIHFGGLGHAPHLEARFSGGLRIDLTPEVLVALIRQGTEALALLPFPPNIHDYCAEDGA